MTTLKELAVFVITLAVIPVTASAQSLDPFSPYASITPSVEAWSMSHYGGLSPDDNTGAMSFCLPVYKYSDPDFNIPVELCYKFDGYRPSENSGTVGYGWYLNCGGVITREVRGLPDEDSIVPDNEKGVMYGYYFTAMDGITSEISNEYTMQHDYSIFANTFYKDALYETEVKDINPFAHIPLYSQVTISPFGMDEKDENGKDIDPSKSIHVAYFISNISNIRYDMAPDIFHFNCLGISGDFMLMPDGHVEVFNSNVPYGTITVEFNVRKMSRNNHDASLSGFTITMADGTCYKFGGTYPSIEYGASYNSGTTGSTSMNLVASAWKLTEITTPGGRRVEFSYSDEKQVYRNLYASYSPCSTELHSNSIKSTQNSYACASTLQSISVDDKKVLEFKYDAKAKDEGTSSFFENAARGTLSGSCIREAEALRLSSINVINSAGQIIDQAILNQGYASSGTPKMFLENVSFKKNGKYFFEYNTSGVTFPKNDTEGTDYWGWWNGKTGLNPLDKNKLDPMKDRYHQVQGTYKDPNLNYSLAGAMTKINYPAGGSTVVEYEANTVEYGLEEEGKIVPVPLAVGGVRVRRMTDKVSATDTGETRLFSYQNGFLYRMPRFGFVIPLSFSFPDQKFFDALYNTAWRYSTVKYYLTAYSNDCDYTVSRDNILDYGTVKITNPDGSYSVSKFYNYNDMYDDYPDYMMCYQYTKRGSVSIHDYFDAPTGYYGPYIASPITDRKNMRRKMLSQTIFDPSGKCLNMKKYKYDAHRVSLDCVFSNNVDSFIRMPWACESPLDIYDAETIYDNEGNGLTVTHRRTFNDKGQVISETEETATDIVSVKYQYNDPVANLWWYDKQLSDAIKTRTIDGITYIIAAEHYDYIKGGIKGRRPVSVKSYVINTPVQVDESASVSDIIRLLSSYKTMKTSFTYNSKGRPIRIDFPGGAYITYTWTSDGKYISSKSVNADDNMIKYEWKDMVGLSKMQDEAGRTETYQYDSCNRLMQRQDTKGNPTEKYYYHLINE